VTAEQAIAHYKKNKCFYLCDAGQRDLFELIVNQKNIINMAIGQILNIGEESSTCPPSVLCTGIKKIDVDCVACWQIYFEREVQHD